MSRIERLVSLCDRGLELLEDDDLAGAARQLEQARKIDPKHADVVRLGAAVAAADGDDQRAFELFEKLAELTPDDATPWISAAHLLLYSADEPEAALAKIERALELVDDEDMLVDAILLRVDALLALDRAADARTTLGELTSSAISDPGMLIAIGDAHLAAGDPKGALRWLARAAEDPEAAADAQHLVGCAHEALGDDDAKTAAWRAVRAADEKTPAPPWHLSHEEFERIAATALAELPARAQELLKDIPVLIDDLPAQGIVDDGFDPRALGLIDGPNLREQAVEGRGATPVNIFLFQKNLEAAFPDPAELAEQIRVTVLHETAHYFGLDEDEVAALGLE